MKTRIIIKENHLAQYHDAMIRGLRKGLDETARDALGKIRGNMTRVGPTGVGVTPDSHVRDTLRVSDIVQTGRGMQIGVYSNDPNALWQERGTRGKKGKAKTARTAARRREKGLGHAGVKGIRFMYRGLKATNFNGHLWRHLP